MWVIWVPCCVIAFAFAAETHQCLRPGGPLLFPCWCCWLLGEAKSSHQGYRQKHLDSRRKAKLMPTERKEHQFFLIKSEKGKRWFSSSWPRWSQDKSFPNLGHRKRRGVREWASLSENRIKGYLTVSWRAPGNHPCGTPQEIEVQGKVRLQERPWAQSIKTAASIEHFVTKNWQCPKLSI